MRYLFFISMLATLLQGCTSPVSTYPRVTIKTELGDIEVELYPARAPKTVAAFLSYVDAGYYKNGSFYRVLSDDNQPSNAPKANLVQGGIWKTNYKRAISLPGIPHEPTNKTHLLHKDGVVSMARQAPGTATTEFFICVGDQPGFDYGGDNNPDGQGYAAFAKCIKGMQVVRKIYNRPADEQSLESPVAIINIVRN